MRGGYRTINGFSLFCQWTFPVYMVRVITSIILPMYQCHTHFSPSHYGYNNGSHQYTSRSKQDGSKLYYISGLLKGVHQFDSLIIFMYSNYHFSKWQILDSSKFKEFADDNFKFDENGRKFLKQVENNVRKGEIVFKSLIMQTGKNQGLFGKGLRTYTKV